MEEEAEEEEEEEEEKEEEEEEKEVGIEFVNHQTVSVHRCGVAGRHMF